MIHIITGLPGTGKSTVTNLLKAKLDAAVYNTDVLFDEMFPDMERTETGGIPDEALLTIYKSLGPKAAQLARKDKNGHYIFEGSFRYKAQRDGIIRELRKINHPYCVIWITMDADENKKRVHERFSTGEAPDTVEDWQEIRDVYEAPNEDEQCLFVIDNTERDIKTPPKHLVEAVDEYIHRYLKKK